MDLPYMKFGHEAMAAPFDVFIAGRERQYAGQVAAAVFAEVDLVERALSRFINSSDVSQINHAATGTPVRVGEHAFECLKASFCTYKDTRGAFDITIGPVLAAWRNPDKSPRTPAAEELERARSLVGMSLLDFDENARTLTLKKPGVQIDLGGVGKGYAVERSADVMADWDVYRALINAGDSTVKALDPPPGQVGWPVGVGGIGDESIPRRTLQLNRRALSGSGFAVKGRHIINPRTGKPAEGKLAAWALCPSATLADALSTAFIVMSSDEVEAYCQAHPDTSAMLIMPDKKVLTFGAW